MKDYDSYDHGIHRIGHKAGLPVMPMFVSPRGFTHERPSGIADDAHMESALSQQASTGGRHDGLEVETDPSRRERDDGAAAERAKFKTGAHSPNREPICRENLRWATTRLLNL